MPRCGTLGDLSVHSIPPTIRAAKRCTGNKAARVAGAVHSPNSAKKFNIPARAINGKDSKSARQRLFCACKTKNERGDLSLSHAWYGRRIPGNTGYMGELACVGSTPAAPSFVRARSCPKRKALSNEGAFALHKINRKD